jgi:polar amino acid transport system permease protein
VTVQSLFLDTPERPASRLVRAATFTLLALLVAAACTAILLTTLRGSTVIWDYRALFWRGFVLTLQISLVSLVLSSVLGLLLALARRSPVLLIRSLASLHVELIRGSPLLVQILFGFYVLADAVDLQSRFVFGVLVLSNFSAAYIAEMIRAGIESVGSSQLDSARAIGLTPVQTLRFVIFPQALRQTLPPLTGQFATLIKDSSLLSIIGLAEFTHAATQINSATYSTLAAFTPLLFGYLALTLTISLAARWLERRFHYDT